MEAKEAFGHTKENVELGLGNITRFSADKNLFRAAEKSSLRWTHDVAVVKIELFAREKMFVSYLKFELVCLSTDQLTDRTPRMVEKSRTAFHHRI